MVRVFACVLSVCICVSERHNMFFLYITGATAIHGCTNGASISEGVGHRSLWLHLHLIVPVNFNCIHYTWKCASQLVNSWSGRLCFHPDEMGSAD